MYLILVMVVAVSRGTTGVGWAAGEICPLTSHQDQFTTSSKFDGKMLGLGTSSKIFE